MYLEDLLLFFLYYWRNIRHAWLLIEFHSISDSAVAWIDTIDNLTQWNLVDLTEIDSINSLMVRQCPRQPLVIMVHRSHSVYQSIFLFLYLFAKIVYLLVLDVLLEQVSVEMTVDTRKSTLWFCDGQLIVIFQMRLHDA